MEQTSRDRGSDPPPARELTTGLLSNADAEPIERILSAAEQCFRSAGYASTSLREIAEAAGVSKSLLHYHFQSKEHLFLEVLVRIYNRLAVRVTESLGEKGTPTERALFGLDALYDALGNNPDIQVQAKVWAHSLSNESLRGHAERLRAHLHAEIVRTMKRILGSAAERLPLSLETTADLLWATVSGLGLQGSTDSNQRVEEAFRGLRRLVEMALEEKAVEEETVG